MITTQKALMRATARIVPVSAALGIALTLGAASAASAAAATPAQPVATKATAYGGHHGHHGDDGGCSGLIVLLCN
jgi:Spy/CpxP family protein refolding chaperone